MSRKSRRPKATGKGQSYSFVQFPHHMLQHARFCALSGRAVKALLYLASQYKGQNNGDLQATFKLARAAGWASAANLADGLRELEDAGFIIRTRQGGRNRCSLFALAWFAIDECGGKHDMAPTRVAPNDWRHDENGTPPAVQCAPPAVQCAPTPYVDDDALNRRQSSPPEIRSPIEPPAVTFLDVPEATPRPATLDQLQVADKVRKLLSAVPDLPIDKLAEMARCTPAQVREALEVQR